MLEVRHDQNEFVVYDSEAEEAVMRFATRRAADTFIAELVIADEHAKLLRWSLERPVASH
jgi:hypothetical protein